MNAPGRSRGQEDNVRSFESEQMTAQELAVLGVQAMAYVRTTEAEGKPAYAIHAADGTQIALLSNRDIAFVTVRQHDLEPLSVH